MMKIPSISFVEILVFVALVKGQIHEDARCKCICSVINGTQFYKKLLITSVPPNNDCNSVVQLPTEERQPNNKIAEICPQCECKYESRNTTIIKFVVILVVWVVSLLSIYMMFLICLDPLLNSRLRNINYMEHTNEEDESPDHRVRSSQHIRMSTTIDSSGAPVVHARTNVLNRVSHQQDKWKRRVREQRKNIYDRHTMLN